MKITASRRFGKKLMALILVIAVMLSMFTGVFAETTSTPVITDINSYAPNGLQNIALNKTVTSSSNENPTNVNLTDGVLGTADAANGWTTDDNTTDSTSPASIQVDLGKVYGINRVVLFPYSGATYGDNFPVDFKIQLSSDGVKYTDVYTSTGNGIPTQPFIIDLSENPQARYVQLYVTKRYTPEIVGDNGLLVQLSEMAVFGYDKTDINSYAPSGLKNIALNKAVFSSSSYEMSNEGWSKAFLTDGILGKPGASSGWTTNPYDHVTDPTVPAYAGVNLGATYSLSRVVLFPRSDATYGDNFPVDFEIQVSSDGQTYTGVYKATGIGIPVQPFIIDLPQNTEAQYVKLYVSKRYSSGTNSTDGKLVQLTEMAVFGKLSKISASLNKNNLLLKPGMTDTLVPTILTDDLSTINLTWDSSNTSVATVNQSGVVNAVATGEATITLSDAANGISETCLVTVTDTIKRPFDNIMLSVFWPPTKDYVNDEQYSYLGDAKINYVQVTTGNDLNEKTTNMEMARLAYKYGMQVGIADTRFGNNLLNLSDTQITDLVNEYKNVPGVGGYYILDEPYNANPYARVFKALKNADPFGYAHLNFLPNIYGSEKTYENQMNDWVKLASQGGHKLDCLMYDRYPFGGAADSMDYTGFLSNMASVWKVGLKNNVKTGTYLQSIGVQGAFRRTNANEIRYEAFMALAFGFKQLSYFTWFTPTNRGEVFTDGIIKADGTKTDLFEPVKQLNGEILQLGPTLMQLDAKEIYLNGNTYGQKAVPADFFVHSQTNDDLTLSYMRDKNTGRNYLMVVNNSFTDEKDVSLKFADAITSVEEVDRADGSLKPVSLANGILNMHFAKGDGHLFALPENYDYEKPAVEPAAGTNLALNAQADCSSSQGSDGYYMGNINDGIRFSDGSTSNGWQSDINTSTPASIVLDLGAERDFNRIDLYPAGDMFSYATYMPKDFTIDISSDRNTWTTVETVTDLQVDRQNVPSYTFDTVKARYVRINISEMNMNDGKYAASMAEIEIYNDDGTVPAAKYQLVADSSKVIEYTSGMNIALNKDVYVSSSTPDNPYKIWGWSKSFVNDGVSGIAPDNKTAGWTSNVGTNFSDSSNQWVAIDFGDLFAVNKIKLSLPANFAYPENYTIDVSEDGVNWVAVKEVTGENLEVRTIDLNEPVPARFVRMTGTKLKLSSADGYLMQVGEIEAYGSPICNKDSLNAEIAVAEAAKADNYSQAAYALISDLIVQAKELSASADTTQTVANDMVKKLSAALAGNYIPNENTVNKVINPVKIDGVTDEPGWKLNQSLDYKMGNSDNTAKAGLMWDDKYLYAAFDVTDANVVNSGAEAPWNDDSVEIYVNGDSSRGAYTEHTVQYIFRVNDDTVYKYGNDAATTDGILKAFKTNANGYTFEVAIPWSDIGGLTVAKGKHISFTAHVDDKDVSDRSVLVTDIIGLTYMNNGDFQDSSKWLEFTLTDTNSGGNGNGGNGGGDIGSGNTDNSTSGGNVTVNGSVISAKPSLTNGSAVSEVTSEILEKAFSNAVKDSNGQKTAKITVEAVQGAKEYVQQLPTSALQSAEGDKKLQIETPVGTVVLPSNALKASTISQGKVELCIASADKSALSEDVRNQIGDKPVVDLYFKVDGKPIAWNNSYAPVKVSIDYKPSAEELKNPEHIVVWYVDNSGKTFAVPNARYDAATGKVIFTTTHFSKYAVAYVNKTFTDIDKFSWAKNQIEVLASKGIISGTSKTEFSPANAITRADFLTLLMNTLGLTQKADSCFDDVKPGDYYYDAVATAKKLGITNGTGNNKFDPKGNITRQDMIVLAEKALKIAKGYTGSGKTADLNRYSDNSQISQYAAQSIADFVKTGLILGSGSSINPKKNTTRAEAAVLMYKIYNMDSLK